MSQHKFKFILNTHEIYLKGNTIRSMFEFAPGHIILCCLKTQQINIIDRNLSFVSKVINNQIFYKGIETNHEFTNQRNLVPLPGFNLITFPFLVLRDDCSLKLIKVGIKNIEIFPILREKPVLCWSYLSHLALNYDKYKQKLTIFMAEWEQIKGSFQPGTNMLHTECILKKYDFHTKLYEALRCFASKK